MKKNTFFTILLGLILIGLNSCSSSKVYSTDASNTAKNLNVSNNKAIVYVFRVSSLGFAVGLNVDCNNSHVATFFPKKFYISVLDTGKYVFTGRGENESDVIVNLEANKKYYIEAVPKIGFASARVRLKLLDQKEGSSQVKRCKLIGMNNQAKELMNYK